ncbi:hypothetical protein PybrP1_005716 [[Pythium] brassicae (nom. inval.)]|nr:hypothetical protein PybrP1_005716 [[Pythium] brassicae (nom. inval.)]
MVLRALWNIGSGLAQRALAKSALRPGLTLEHAAVWKARPGILDCDINLHLNNSSYLYNMELARWHFTAVNGILTNVLKKRQTFLVASQAIRYRHPIPPLKPYEVHTRLVYCDDAWLYFLQQFLCPTTGKVYAEGLARATVREGKKVVSAAALYAEIGDASALPTEMPEAVREFLRWDAASKASMEEAATGAQRELKASPPKRGLHAELTRSWNTPV